MERSKNARPWHTFSDFAMMINDPSLWPAGFGPLRLETLGEDPLDGEVFVLKHGDTIHGELVRLNHRHGTLMLDEDDDCVVGLSRCWSVDLIPQHGLAAETHILCPAWETEADRKLPGPEVAAWAMLTVLLASTHSPPGRG
jgi:hypothetical protein